MSKGFERSPERRYKKFAQVLRIWEEEIEQEPNFIKWLEKEETKENCRLYIAEDA